MARNADAGFLVPHPGTFRPSLASLGGMNDAEDEARIVRLKDGGEARMRPLVPGDLEAFERFHAALSPETRYLRYFTARPKLPAQELHRYTHPDPGRHLGLAAWIDGEIVAHGCYQRVQVAGEAEVAFEVADAHQGRGLATLLFEGLAEAARPHGIERFVAHVLPTNRRMLDVFQKVGYEEESEREAGAIRVDIDLSETDEHRVAVRQRADVAESSE